MPLQLGFKEDKALIPEIIEQLLLNYQVYLELAYPISIGKKYEYPYRKAQTLIQHLYETFGPSKLIWGSDIPNVERYCTYRQSLNYLTDYCNFLSTKDKELICGKNVLQIFKLE